jgi:ribosomal protein S15P/S13E
MSEVDFEDLQRQAEALARSEYQEAFADLAKQRSELEFQRGVWSVAIQDIRKNFPDFIGEDDDSAAIIKEIAGLVHESVKIKKLLDYIKGNEALQKQWDTMLMTIRLTGGDEL